MIVDENTKFVPVLTDYWDISYAVIEAVPARVYLSPEPTPPTFFDKKTARFTEYSEQKTTKFFQNDGWHVRIEKVGGYIVALAPEINTVFFKIGK